MNQVLKQLSMLAFALVFMAGTAFAQENNDNDADITQDGLANEAMVDQDLNGHVASGKFLKAVVSQTGEDNDVSIKQVSNNQSDADGALADVIQNGNLNEALIDQNRRRKAAARLSQIQGNENKANIYQGPGDVLKGYSGDRALQQGSNNTLDVVQTRDPNNLQQNTGNSFETAGVSQIGDSNTASVIQASPNGGGVFNNDAFLLQDGDHNFADLVQQGNTNFVDVKQSHDMNSATTMQNGAGNVINVVQDGGDVFP